jgi:hypothetical protein
MTESAHAFDEADPTKAGGPEVSRPRRQSQRQRKKKSVTINEDMDDFKEEMVPELKKRSESDDDSEDDSDEDSVKETGMHPSTSSVLLTQTVEQRINELAMTLTRDQLTTNAIEHINKWQDIITDDDGDSKDDLARHTEANDAVPLAFLIADKSNNITAVQTIGIARLENRHSAANGTYFGFVGDAQENGRNVATPNNPGSGNHGAF